MIMLRRIGVYIRTFFHTIHSRSCESGSMSRDVVDHTHTPNRGGAPEEMGHSRSLVSSFLPRCPEVSGCFPGLCVASGECAQSGEPIGVVHAASCGSSSGAGFGGGQIIVWWTLAVLVGGGCNRNQIDVFKFVANVPCAALQEQTRHAKRDICCKTGKL